MPWPRTHMPLQHRTEGDWNRPGQADLTTVGMATQKQIEAGMCSLAIDFGCMRQQNRKCVLWNFGRCLLDIVDPIVVGIVDAGQVNRCVATRNWFAFVEQYPNSHFFEFGDHANGIVISQHSVDWPLEMHARSCQAFERSIEWPKCRTTIVTSQNAYVIGQARKNLIQAPHRAFARIHV